MKYIVLTAIATAFIFTGCNNQKMDADKHHEAVLARMDSAQKELLQTDIAFSQLSEQQGRSAAFIAYADDNATLLRPNSMPVSGRDTITSLLKLHSDSTHILSWTPLRAEVSHSADFGFTYGTYSEDIKGKDKEEGTYCTIWKKDKDNKWKFVLDTGNPGLTSAEKAEDEKENKAKEKAEKKDAPKAHKKHKKH